MFAGAWLVVPKSQKRQAHCSRLASAPSCRTHTQSCMTCINLRYLVSVGKLPGPPYRLPKAARPYEILSACCATTAHPSAYYQRYLSLPRGIGFFLIRHVGDKRTTKRYNPPVRSSIKVPPAPKPETPSDAKRDGLPGVDPMLQWGTPYAFVSSSLRQSSRLSLVTAPLGFSLAAMREG